MSVTDVCHLAYADQLEEMIRDQGPITTGELVRRMHPTPTVMEGRARHGNKANSAAAIPMADRWLEPYLRMLRERRRIYYAGGWQTPIAGKVRLPPELVDPTVVEE